MPSRPAVSIGPPGASAKSVMAAPASVAARPIWPVRETEAAGDLTCTAPSPRGSIQRFRLQLRRPSRPVSCGQFGLCPRMPMTRNQPTGILPPSASVEKRASDPPNFLDERAGAPGPAERQFAGDPGRPPWLFDMHRGEGHEPPHFGRVGPPCRLLSVRVRAVVTPITAARNNANGCSLPATLTRSPQDYGTQRQW